LPNKEAGSCGVQQGSDGILGNGLKRGVELDEGEVVPSPLRVPDSLGKDFFAGEGGEGSAVGRDALGEGVLDEEGVGAKVRVCLFQ